MTGLGGTGTWGFTGGDDRLYIRADLVAVPNLGDGVVKFDAPDLYEAGDEALANNMEPMPAASRIEGVPTEWTGTVKDLADEVTSEPWNRERGTHLTRPISVSSIAAKMTQMTYAGNVRTRAHTGSVHHQCSKSGHMR